MVHAMEHLPKTSKEAFLLITECQAQWDEGGKDQIHRVFHQAFSVLVQGENGCGSFPLLVHAALAYQVYQPRLDISALSTLLLTFVPEPAVEKEAKAHSASSSRLPTPEDDLSEDTRNRVLLSDTLLDVVWALDAEIDAKRELASSQNTSLLASAADESLDQQMKIVRERLADIVRDFINKKLVNRLQVAQRLEVPLLGAIGLVDDEVGFSRRGIRINTATLYKQQKFNLLREENEGYSGLINQLLQGMGPPIVAVRDGAFSSRVVEQETPECRNIRVDKVMKNISALIGYFDLDPNRVLDVILDIFSTNVVHHWPFFLALLASSPWSANFPSKDDGSLNGNGQAMDIDPVDSDTWLGPIDMSRDSTPSQHTCCQVLGFKFGYYQLQETSEKVPEELYLTAAILIRQGYIRLTDLYPHLTPDEAGMTALHEKFKVALSDKASSAKGNALSMAAPLTADEPDSAKLEKSQSKEGANAQDSAPPKEPPNQILGILEALLAVGQLKDALFILQRYPWLCSAYPRVADLYCRTLEVILEPAYASISFQALDPIFSLSGTPDRMKYDPKKQELVAAPQPNELVTSIAPEPQSTASSRFVYFFGPWNDQLPRCQVEDVLSQFVPLLRILGTNLFRSMLLFQKLCRLGRSAMRTPSLSEEDRVSWLEVVRNFLLPALSMSSGNPGLVTELWLILRPLSYAQRYSLYGEWKNSLYRRPELRVRQAETEKEAKGILKRISSDNIKLSGRSLAKASHANPTIFFTVALNQVQSYSNLIAPIVECAKYLTQFEYDVFGFNLIDALSNPEKERTKQDGTSVSQWLQSLAAFTGTLYRRYAMMDCTSILQYIANQLKENNTKDLVIIRELVLKMAGIEPLANLSDSQVAALTGGRLLRMEAMMVANAGIATSTRVQLRKSGSRLLLALRQSRMDMPLLILIAQQRQACVHLVPDSEAHLKYLGNLFDTCQEVLFQYVEFLHNQLDPQAYSDLIPSAGDLCRRFEVEPSIAFHIVRPRLTLKVRAAEAKDNEERLRKELLASKARSASKDAVDVADTDKTVEQGADSSESKDVEQNSKHEEEPSEAKEDMSVDAAHESQSQHPWRDGLEEAVKAADDILSEQVKEVLGVNFYATFWQLGLADIVVPTDRYEQEIKGLQQIVDDNPEGSRRSLPKVRMQAQDLIKQLRSELKDQTLNHQATRRRLSLEKDHWFKDTCTRSEIVYQLLQYCIIPRALLSPTDAIFAGRFLRLMHANGTRNFSSLTAYDKIIVEQIGPLIFSSTENEARNLARFLHTILVDIQAWYSDENRYRSECGGNNLPGFQMRWGDRHGGEEIPQADYLGHEHFKQVTLKWHGILRAMFRECLMSREYMRIRNVIVIMTRIAQQFPQWEMHGADIVECVSTVAREEERGDLKILCQGLLATLKKEQKNWISTKKPAAATPKAASAVESATKDGESKGVEPKATALKSRDHKTAESIETASKNVEPPPLSRSASTNNLPERSESTIRSRQSSQDDAGRRQSNSVAASRSNTPSRSAGDSSRETASVPPSTSSSGRTKDVSSISAARQAALDSMSQGNMNPPRNPVAGREKFAPNERGSEGTARTSASAKAEDKDSRHGSRAVVSAKAEDTDSRHGSRAGSEDPTSKQRNDRTHRDWQRDTDYDRHRHNDGQRHPSYGRRDGEREDRDRYGPNRDGARFSRYRNEQDRDKGYDAARRTRDVDVRRTSDRPDNRSQSSLSDQRGPSREGNRTISSSKTEGNRTVSSSNAEENKQSPRMAEERVKADAGAENETGKQSPASPSSKKRSLADRLTLSEPQSSPSNVTDGSPQRQISQDDKSNEPNKRARTSRGNESDYRSNPRNSYRGADDGKYSGHDRRDAKDAEQGISIQGQGRSGKPNYVRRDSQRAHYYDNSNDRRNTDRFRGTESPNMRNNNNRGNQDRDRRRSERRSGF